MITNKSQLMFLACVDLSKNYSGIARKVLTEYNTLNKYIPSILIGYYKNGIVIYNGNKSIVIEKVKKHRRKWQKLEKLLVLLANFLLHFFVVLSNKARCL